VSDVLLNLYRSQPGDPLVSGYNTITADLTSFLSTHLGETLRLRFAEADNVQVLNAGLDRVSLVVPEPSVSVMVLIGLVFLGAAYARHERRRWRAALARIATVRIL
jgi:hypothetical protein